MTPTLLHEHRDMLNFEARWPTHSVAKEQAIRAQFGMSAARFYQVLSRLSVRREVIAADPFLAARIRASLTGRTPMLREDQADQGERPVASTSGFELSA